MPPKATAKSAPVPVSTPLADTEEWYALKQDAKGIDARLESMKPRMLAIVPSGQTEERLYATRNGVKGYYTVKRIIQDRRKINPDMLKAKLEEAGLFVRASKVVPDEDKVAALIEEKKFSAEALRDCLEGAQPIYPTVEWVEKK